VIQEDIKNLLGDIIGHHQKKMGYTCPILNGYRICTNLKAFLMVIKLSHYIPGEALRASGN
jgi:hypothetical protein